jgi:hypothetical protein
MAKLYCINSPIIPPENVEQILNIQLCHGDIVCFIHYDIINPYYVSKHRSLIICPKDNIGRINIPYELTRDFDNTMEIYADIIKKYGNLINEIHLSLNDKFILEFFPNIPESQNKENNVKINKIVAYYPFTNLQIDISRA